MEGQKASEFFLSFGWISCWGLSTLYERLFLGHKVYFFFQVSWQHPNKYINERK